MLNDAIQIFTATLVTNCLQEIEVNEVTCATNSGEKKNANVKEREVKIRGGHTYRLSVRP